MTALATRNSRKTQIGRIRDAAADAYGFATPREFFESVVRASVGSRRIDDRLKPLATAGSDEQQTQAGNLGGYLIPQALLPGFAANTTEGDLLADRVMNAKMTSPVCSFPARVDANHQTSVSGGLTVRRRMETNAITISQMQMRQVVLDATGMFGAAFATEEMCMDSREVFAAVLSAGFSDEISATLMQERLYGTGSGQFLGVMNSPALITVPKDNSQAADTISATNVMGMRRQCFGYRNAIWLANHDAYEQIAGLTLTSGTSVVQLFVPTNREGEPDLLGGRPIIFNEYCLTTGTPGDLILGNWTQYVQGTLERGDGMSVEVRFVEHERCFKFWVRNDAAPWWLSTMTPKNGAYSLSPFLALATRS